MPPPRRWPYKNDCISDNIIIIMVTRTNALRNYRYISPPLQVYACTIFSDSISQWHFESASMCTYVLNNNDNRLTCELISNEMSHRAVLGVCETKNKSIFVRCKTSAQTRPSPPFSS